MRPDKKGLNPYSYMFQMTAKGHGMTPDSYAAMAKILSAHPEIPGQPRRAETARIVAQEIKDRMACKR